MSAQRSHRNIAAVGLLMAVAAQGLFAVSQAADVKPASTQMEQVVHDYILAHPEVLLESVRSYDAHLKAEAKEQARDKIKAHLSELYQNSPAVESMATIGSEPVTLVEFFDYRCGYCKKVEGTVAELALKPGVRIVYKDFPILGPDSIAAAQAALAAEKQGGYEKLHHVLLAAPTLDQASIEKIAAQVGLDVPRLKRDMKSSEVSVALERNRKLAEQLGIQSTPSFVVGTDLVSGALTPQAFQSLINEARHQVAVPKPNPTAGF